MLVYSPHWLIPGCTVHGNENQGERGQPREKCPPTPTSWPQQVPPSCLPSLATQPPAQAAGAGLKVGNGSLAQPGGSLAQPGPCSGSASFRSQAAPSHPGCCRHMSAGEFWFDVAGLLLFQNATEGACMAQGSHFSSSLGPGASIWGHLR